MGGKTRTKNNLRPSNSGRVAELLGNSSTFVGFSTAQSSGTNSNAMSGFACDTDEDFCDDNLKIILKKLAKKDPVTRAKGSQELTRFVAEATDESFKQLIPFWPKHYNNLFSDNDHRVREAVQQAHLAIVMKAGKNIAPYLKQLSGSWVTAQFDTHVVAASIARNSFEKSFPNLQKQKNMLLHCEVELLEFLTKNLTVLDLTTFLNTKNHTQEECESKYQRLLVTSLRGLNFYLQRVNMVDESKCSDQVNTLLLHQKFWTFFKNESVFIRSAWYEVMSTVLKECPTLVESHYSQITLLVFKQMGEEDTLVVPFLWACIVLVQTNVPNWESNISMDKLVLPKLWKILRSSAFNNASIVFPFLLPFISKINKQQLGTAWDGFYERFFSELSAGVKATHNSKSEMNVVVTTYYEILKYTVIQLVRDPVQEPKCIKLIDDHVISMIYWSFNTKGQITNIIYSQIANLLSYWGSKQANEPAYCDLLKHFWSELHLIFESTSQSRSDIEKYSSSYVDLVKSLKSTSKATKTGVKFSDDVCDSTNAVVEMDSIKELPSLVAKLCKMCMEKVDEYKISTLIEHLETLFKEFHDVKLFKLLSPSNDLMSFFGVLFRWLNDKDIACESILEITLIIFNYLSTEEKERILTKLSSITNTQVQNWILIRFVSYPMNTISIIPTLLATSGIRSRLIESAMLVVEGKTTNNLNLLQKCFFQTASGNILLENSVCEEIVDLVSQALINENNVENLDLCASFVAQIMPVICNDPDKSVLQVRTFLRLFQFSCENVVSDSLSEDTLWEVTTCWQDALSAGDIILSDVILKDCANLVASTLMKNNSIKIFEHLSTICAKFIECSLENEEENSVKIAKALEMYKILTDPNDEYPSCKQYIEKYCLFLCSLNGVILNKNLDSDIVFVDVELNVYLKTFVVLSGFKSYLLHKLTVSPVEDGIREHLSKSIENDDEYLNTSMQKPSLIKIWTQDVFLEYMFELVNSYSISDVIINSSYCIEEDYLLVLIEKVTSLVQNLHVETISNFKTQWYKWILADSTGFSMYSIIAIHNLSCFKDFENVLAVVYNELKTFLSREHEMTKYINILQVLALKSKFQTIPIVENLLENNANLHAKIVAATSLVKNHFTNNFNDSQDFKVIGNVLIILHEILTKQKSKPFLKYEMNISSETPSDVALVVDVIQLVVLSLRYFPTELDKSRWDFIRLALSSWILSTSKTIHDIRSEKAALFVSSVFSLYAEMQKFLKSEQQKSSTELLVSVIQEWNEVFAKETSLVLLKSFWNLISSFEGLSIQQRLFDQIKNNLTWIELHFNKDAKDSDSTSLKSFVESCIENISCSTHSIRYSCLNLLKSATQYIVESDLQILNSSNDQDVTRQDTQHKHTLMFFESKLISLDNEIKQYLLDLVNIDEDIDFNFTFATPYLLLWNAVLNLCSCAPVELRSIYIAWITEKKFEVTLLSLLFEIFPQDATNSLPFVHDGWQTLVTDHKSSIIKLSSATYAFALRSIPVLVRKWFKGLPTKQSMFVEKITTNFFTPVICSEELSSLIQKKDVYETMNIKVYMPSRQVTAIYTIGEANFELIVDLPTNYPLGCVKIEAGKQIGGRMQSRQTLMQCTIFLTHQNGSLWDGLSLWKKNLDRKFEGVEECYICYSVIHQDTYQLPRLSCKTCRKKFHGPCLWKWFSTSNKSSCPICRNIF